MDVVNEAHLEQLVREKGTSEGGGKMVRTMYGVLDKDPATDLQLLIDNYSVRNLASALRDREDILQQAAVLAQQGNLQALQDFLKVYHPRYVLERRNRKRGPDPTETLQLPSLRRALTRMPRTVTSAHSKRAAVCLALCTVDGLPSILLEKRAPNLRTHPDEVCLPGGMVCDIQDTTVVDTSIREMKEEIGGLEDRDPEVLGVLRLDWGEVHHITGVAVTPVVIFLGELPQTLTPSPDEVAQVFTVSLKDLMENAHWEYKEGLAPLFVGGPHLIWGLSGYILDRFRKHILRPLHHESDE